MENAEPPPLGMWTKGCICCSGGERWYKFVADGDEPVHTIVAKGMVDTIGYLYDSSGNAIAYDDDSGEEMNFRIVATLDAGKTYYLKVKQRSEQVQKFTICVMAGIYPDKVTLDHPALLLEVGETATLQATVTPTDVTDLEFYGVTNHDMIELLGTESNTDPKTITFKAKDLLGTSYVRAIAKGKYGISKFADCEVTVGQGIIMFPEDLYMKAGQTETVAIHVRPIGMAYSVTSSNPSVATVYKDENGNAVVTAVADGTATITAITSQGISDSCQVTVRTPVSSVTVTPSSTNSTGGFRNLSMLSATSEDTETDAPVMLGVQFKELQGGNYSIRFVAQIKTLQYNAVGYEIHYKFGDAAPIDDVISQNIVYSALIADGELVYPDEGYNYFLVYVIENIPQNTVASFRIVPVATTLAEEYVCGRVSSFNCKNSHIIDYYYISNKTDDTGNTVISYKNALGGSSKNDTSRANVCVEPLTRVGKQIWRITNISNTADGQIKAYLDEDYGFNAQRKTTGNFNCDLIKVADNADANVRFVDQGNGYYKIRLASDMSSDYYLTLDATSNDVRWQNTDEDDRQLWKLNMVDWEQFEAEQVEYHLIPQIATNYALYAYKPTPIERLTEDTEVRLKEFSYMNRHRWLIKTSGTSKRLYNQYGDNFVLCKKDEDKVYASNDLSNECDITIVPYNAENMVEIKLTQSNLYLTASGTDVTWESYNSSNHSSQLWELRAFPSDCYSGCDIGQQLTETTVKALKKSGEKFVFRYYKPVTIKGNEITKFDNSDLEATIAILGNDGLNICQKSEAEIDIDHDINASAFANYVNNLLTSDVVLHRNKTLTLNEISYFRKNQLKIGSLYQDDGQEIQFFDPRHAQIDALCALVCAKVLGQPKNTTIYFGVDELFYTQSQLNTIELYFNIVRKIVNYAGYKIGVYGGDRVCKKVKDNMVNQVNGLESPILTFIGQGEDAWDNYPDVVANAELRQGDYFCYNEVTFDRNVALKPNYGFWE